MFCSFLEILFQIQPFSCVIGQSGLIWWGRGFRDHVSLRGVRPFSTQLSHTAKMEFARRFKVWTELILFT